MKPRRTIEIMTEEGLSINIPFYFEGEREAAVVTIDGVRCHLERIHREQLMSEYRVDSDPNYDPQVNTEGFCYILVPFSK